MATFNDEVTLIGIAPDDYEYDDDGNPILENTEVTVLCNELGVFGSDFYSAGTVGLKPSYRLSLHEFEYSNQEKVRYKNVTYDVLRTYKSDGLIELTIGQKVGDSNG